MNRNLALLILALLSLALVPLSASAKDLFVPDSLASLQEAFDQLGEGDRILLGPGTYNIDPVVVSGFGFSLIGGEGREATILTSSSEEQPILSIAADGQAVRIEGVKFDKTDRKAVYSVVIGRADVEILDCDLIAGAGIQIDSSEGVIRGNRFLGCFDALKVLNSPLLVEHNLFEGTVQYGLICRGSTAEVYNNKFNKGGSASILIIGKRRYPVIGGSPGKGNTFLQHEWVIVVNDSRNEINARYNYWGGGPTAVMKELGYPADIDMISDRWDGEDRVRGYVDYSEWLESAPGSGEESTAKIAQAEGRTVPAGVIGGGAAILVIALILVMRGARRSD